MSAHGITASALTGIWPGLALALLLAGQAHADAVTDWSLRDCDIISAANPGTPMANRVMALAHTAAFEAANAITGRYPKLRGETRAASGASVDAAIAAAHHAILLRLLPAQRENIDQAYSAAMTALANNPGRDAGIAAGEQAAAALLLRRAEDSAGVEASESYRPSTSPGVYVPTVLPAVPQWPRRKPWLLAEAAQLRPAAPPALGSEQWARDYNEVKSLGRRDSKTRSAAQTDNARFWEAALPSIYHGVVRSVANSPGRDVMQNARLFAAATQAADDAIIAVFDAKYHYAFWRPITAIRNGDTDANAATERDASWLPFLDTPMHPEYPCAHCIVAATIGTILQAEINAGATPRLATRSPTAAGAEHSWHSVEEFIQEVANARIHAGVHYRTSTEVAVAMGREIGALAVGKYFNQ
jgi:hypothetical protein